MDKLDMAIERLRMADKMAKEMYQKPLNVCYSGGKDSQVLLDVALKAGIDFTVSHNLTTVDAPETIRTIRETFAYLDSRGIEAVISHPPLNMWQLIVKHKTPPTRIMRYCCKELKERSSVGRFIATGVRKGESVRRRSRDVVDVLADKKEEREGFGDEVFLSNDNTENRRMLERCNPKGAMCVNPLIDWTDREVVDYYFSECRFHNPLYTEGFQRVGCIGCPMGGVHQREREFARYPMFKRAYIRAFDKMLIAREEKGLKTFDMWTDGEGVFRWWMEDKNLPGQLTLELEET